MTYINGADMVVLSAFKTELQRIIDLSLVVDPKVIEFIEGRILSIEEPTPKTGEEALS
jgi:hypothetical protein